MIYSRYYYTTLNDRDKQVYKLVYNAIEEHRPTVTAPKPDVGVADIIKFINLDNPHIYYAELTKCSYLDMGDEIMLELTYFYTKEEIEELNRKVNKVLGRMLLRINGDGKSDFEKVKAVHDLLAEHINYDYHALANLNKYYTLSNSVLGVLFEKKAVCEGISKVAKYLLNLMDVKCIVAEGYSVKENGPHAWNIVKIDGVPYHLDITWDINVSSDGCIRYDYFCLCDKDIQNDHRFGHDYPSCKSKDAGYYKKCGVESPDLKGFEDHIVEAKRRGENYFVFRCTCRAADFKKELFSLMDRASSKEKLGRVKVNFNSDQQVCAVIFMR